MDRVLGIINVFTNTAIGLIALALPILTGFDGIPALAFVAAALLLGSVALYRVEVPDLRMASAINRGRHELPSDLQRKSRWPYTLTYMTGFVLIFVYIPTILRHF